MDWSAPLDLYCERLGPGFLAEPLNAFSNVSFILAGLWMLRRLRQLALPGWDLRLLCWLVVLVGLGSAVFHAVATRWASVLDIAFIGVFIYVFLASFVRRFAAASRAAVAAVLVAYSLLDRTAAALIPRDALNGSVLYLPAWLGLLVCSALASLWADCGARKLWLALALFTVSLAFRTIDQQLCDRLPIGTHFIWHLLNAAFLPLLVQALARQRS